MEFDACYTTLMTFVTGRHLLGLHSPESGSCKPSWLPKEEAPQAGQSRVGVPRLPMTQTCRSQSRQRTPLAPLLLLAVGPSRALTLPGLVLAGPAHRAAQLVADRGVQLHRPGFRVPSSRLQQVLATPSRRLQAGAARCCPLPRARLLCSSSLSSLVGSQRRQQHSRQEDEPRSICCSPRTTQLPLLQQDQQSLAAEWAPWTCCSARQRT